MSENENIKTQETVADVQNDLALEILSNNSKLSLSQVEEIRHLSSQFLTERKSISNELKSFSSDPTKSLIAKWITKEELDSKDFSKAEKDVAEFVKAHIALKEKDLEKAISILSKIATSKDCAPAGILLNQIYIKANKLDEANALVKSLKKAFSDDPGVACEEGHLLEIEGQWEKALEIYEGVIESHPDNPHACFKAAHLLDLRGEDDKAEELYKISAGAKTCFTGALINLGLLFEDKEEFNSAVECYKRVLDADPTNKRAQLYLRNAEGSVNMYFDEVEQKETEKSMQVLRTPVTDFELSVRSRNCLAKMNIKSLGDLVQKTESELLLYKNFGETSLREIKEMLKQKGLRLGQGLETDRRRTKDIKRKVLSQTQFDSDILNQPVSRLNLSVRASKCMNNVGVMVIGELVQKSEKELLAVENFGQTSLTEIKQKLEAEGLKLKDD